MNPFDDTLHRVLARHRNRAVATRTTSALSNDPDISIGIATIKIVTEEQIQAIAYGSLHNEPEVIVRLDPIGRDVNDLVPFADFMEQTTSRAQIAGSALRVWVPHSATIEALDILGHRYWRNQTAPSAIVRMGEICRVLAHEATFPGQQVVADASALLQRHVATGLAPVEEGHLDAILAWLDPAVRDPLAESRERIRLPASGILPNTPVYPIDDRVDRLRKEAKGATGRRRAILQEQLAAILRHWVLREWRLLVQARQAYLNLGLSSSGLDCLVNESTERLNYALANGHFPARRPDKLAVLLAQMESGLEKTELAALESDPVLREQAQRAGGVVCGTVSDVRQLRRNFKPCDIDLDSAQAIVRLRIDDKVQVVGTKVAGIVRALAAIPGGTRVSIEITSGVRQTEVLSVGARVEIIRAGYGFVNYKAFKLVSQRQPWPFFSEAAPEIDPGPPTRRSALAIAAEARRR